jgi:hypothetical protein
VESSPPAIEEAEEIESRQGIGWSLKKTCKKTFKYCTFHGWTLGHAFFRIFLLRLLRTRCCVERHNMNNKFRIIWLKNLAETYLPGQ